MKVDEERGLLHYITVGDGPLVILLHGLLMDGSSWISNGLVDILRSDFTVAFPDMLGHGESKSIINAGYDQKSQAGMIRDLIDKSGFKKAHVIGYSSGAWLALGLVKFHPEYLSSLVIGGWDVQNGLPDGPHGRLDYETFFSYAQVTAPALTSWVTAEDHPSLRSYFNALAEYDGSKDAPLTNDINIPKFFWAGDTDAYYQPLKTWAETNEQEFVSVQGDHVSAIMEMSPSLLERIHEFLYRASFN